MNLCSWNKVRFNTLQNMKTIKKTSLRQHHWTRLFFVCFSLLSFYHSATAEVVSDTCIVKYKGDSLLVITDTLKGSNVEIDYHVSYVNRPFKNYCPQPLTEYSLRKYEDQKAFYIHLPKSKVMPFIDKTIQNVLTAKKVVKLKRDHPYDFRTIDLDISKDGIINAAKLFIRTKEQFQFIGGVKECGKILDAFIGKQAPKENLPNLADGFCIGMEFFIVPPIE